MNLDQLLQLSVHKNASDLHLSPGLSPILRIDGRLYTSALPQLTADDMMRLAQPLLPAQPMEKQEVDLAYEITDLARFRITLFRHRGGIGIVSRVIPWQIKSMAELDLPATLAERVLGEQGLVLVTGATGCGKSTTLAALVDHLNQCQRKHIVTIEDPIEFVHRSQLCLITQRQVGRDTVSFQQALRAALREDPDVILVGELRDLETVRLALTAAETGHLVLATLHTTSAVHTVHRIIDVFPGNEKSVVRALLADCLQAVITQRLVKHNDPDKDRMALLEIMLTNSAISNLIREDKIAQIYSVMQTQRAAGMQTFAQAR